jgi:hypothetical protein
MNEADTPDTGAWRKPPDASAVQPENTGCPFYSVVANQMAIPKLLPARIMKTDERNESHQFEVEGLENDNANNHVDTHQYIDSEYDQVLTLGNEEWETQILDNADEDKDEDTTASETPDIPKADDWVAEPDREKQAVVDNEFQQLLALNQDLLAANDKLYQQVEELTLALTESQKALQLQKKRSSVTETILKQQTEELAAAQKQIESLYLQLETSLQKAQHQETLAETYKAQFELSLSRLAQLERECALLQTTHNEQSQHLLQSETACRELRTRLMRQQRQTLQFKAALEKCLEAPIPTSQEELTEDDFNDIEAEQLSPSLKKFRSLFVNADPIRPWSVDQGAVEKNQDILGDTAADASDSVIGEDESQQESVPISKSEDKIATWQPAASPSLEEQIDSVIKIFLTSQSPSTSAEMPFKLDLDIDDQEIESNAFESSVTDMQSEDITTFEQWDNTQGMIHPRIIEELTNPTEFNLPSENTIPVKSGNVIESNNPAIYAEPVIETTSSSNQEESEDYWAEVSQLTHLDLPTADSPLHPSHHIDDGNSPSPVVYPKRPPKGRKSLASVELPKFHPPKS